METKYPISYHTQMPDERLKDFLTPAFRVDSHGSQVMPFGGYNNLKMNVTPGSKIISQSSTNESGVGNISPSALGSGTIPSKIWIGNKVYLNGDDGYVLTGTDIDLPGTKTVLSEDYLAGFDGPAETKNMVFGFFLKDTARYHEGDFVLGKYDQASGMYWDNQNQTLNIKGNVNFGGNLASSNYSPGSEDACGVTTGGVGWKIDFETGSSEFNNTVIRGKVISAEGNIAGWLIDANRIYKRNPCSGLETSAHIKSELSSRYNETLGDYPHIQLMVTQDGQTEAQSSYIQLTTGKRSDANPYLASYVNGVMRVKLDKDGLSFFAANGNLVGKVLGDTTAGTDHGTMTFSDLRIANDTVRIFANGVRVSLGNGINLADSTGQYMQMFVDSATDIGIISLPFADRLIMQSDRTSGGSRPGPDLVYFNGPRSGNFGTFSGLVEFEAVVALLSANPGNVEIAGKDWNFGGALYFDQVNQKLRIFQSGAWQDVGGATPLMPSGNIWQMLVCAGGTTWNPTNNVYVGGSLSGGGAYLDYYNGGIRPSLTFYTKHVQPDGTGTWTLGSSANGYYGLFLQQVLASPSGHCIFYDTGKIYHTNDVAAFGSLYATGNVFSGTGTIGGGNGAVYGQRFERLDGGALILTTHTGDLTIQTTTLGLIYILSPQGVYMSTSGNNQFVSTQSNIFRTNQGGVFSGPTTQFYNAGIKTMEISETGVTLGTVGVLSGTSGTLFMNLAGRLQISTHLDPPDAGTKNLGGTTRYWNEVHCNNIQILVGGIWKTFQPETGAYDATKYYLRAT